MSKRNGKSGDDATGDDDLTLERLRRHLAFLGLTRTLDELDGRLAWAVRERPGPTALLEHWGKYLGDATLTAAILDRLVMHGLRIDIDGPSYRQHIAHERAAGRDAQRTERERPARRDADGG
jgi:hypothetical protein